MKNVVGMKRLLAALLGIGLLAAGACAPRLQPPGDMAVPPAFMSAADSWQASDGRVLPLRRWLPEGKPAAVVLAVHGFNDYSNAFTEPGEWWAKRGIATYAPDQRGFGQSAFRGFWPGQTRMTRDIVELSRSLRQRHPDTPLFWLGESMGGAVTLVALEEGDVRPDGLVLVAPAVWGRESMPWYYSATLWVAAHTIPWKTFTGSGLKIQASDNIEMLRRLSRDPLFIKATRVDTIYGLVDLMDRSAKTRPRGLPVLLLYGAKDEVIPKQPVEKYVAALKADPGVDMRVAIYADGWHMLLRDLQAEVVWRDIAAWLGDRKARLPSGAERRDLPLFPDEKELPK